MLVKTLQSFLIIGVKLFNHQLFYPIGDTSHSEYITIRNLNQDNKLDRVIMDSIKDQIDILLYSYRNGSFALVRIYYCRVCE